MYRCHTLCWNTGHTCSSGAIWPAGARRSREWTIDERCVATWLCGLVGHAGIPDVHLKTHCYTHVVLHWTYL